MRVLQLSQASPSVSYVSWFKTWEVLRRGQFPSTPLPKIFIFWRGGTLYTSWLDINLWRTSQDSLKMVLAWGRPQNNLLKRINFFWGGTMYTPIFESDCEEPVRTLKKVSWGPGAYSGICPGGFLHFFLFLGGGCQHSLGPEHPHISVDFTGPVGRLAPIAPPI